MTDASAYVVLSHRGPDQVLRLARTLRTGSPESTVVLHHDDRAVALDEARCARSAASSACCRRRRSRGAGRRSSTCCCAACAWALERVEFDWLVVLSGQDYPIRPLADDRGVAARPAASTATSKAWRSLRRRGRATARTSSRAGTSTATGPCARPVPAVRRAVAAARPLLEPARHAVGRGARRPQRRPAAARAPRLGLADAVAARRRGGRGRVRRSSSATIDAPCRPTESLPHTVLLRRPVAAAERRHAPLFRLGAGSLHPAVLRPGRPRRASSPRAPTSRASSTTVDAPCSTRSTGWSLRMKAPLQRLLERAGYSVYRDVPRDLANPLGGRAGRAPRAAAGGAGARGREPRARRRRAHAAATATLLREAGYGGEIVSFEPVAASFAALERRAADDPRWRAHRLALGREPGTAQLNVARESNFTSFLRAERVLRRALRRQRGRPPRGGRGRAPGRGLRRADRAVPRRRACCSRPTRRAGTSR